MGAYRKGWVIGLVMVAVLAAGFFGGFKVGQKGKPESTPGILIPGSPAFAMLQELGSLSEVAARAMPSVVNISSLKATRIPGEHPFSPFFEDPFFRRFFGEEFFRFFEIPRERRQRSLGSGVIVRSDGYILTNNHVVEGATEVKVSLPDKREFKAKIIGTDSSTDLAVLKIEAKDLSALPLGDSDRIRVGDIVLAIGNPFGIGETVTMGIISAVGRANVGVADYEDFIQTDAAINPGNSGGALVDMRGQLIGINTAILTRTGGYQGIGFAIPSNMARVVMESIIKYGKVTRGWLGVMIQEVTPQIAQAFGLKQIRGALVSDVLRGSPAERAGIKRGDVIVEYEGKGVEGVADLKNLVAQTKPGSRVKVKLIRGGEEQVVEVIIEELSEKYARGPERQGEMGTILEGLQVEDITPELRENLELPEELTGVVVTEVEPYSRAARAGLRVGDIIQEVNRQPVKDAGGFERAVAQSAGRPLLLLVYREGSVFYLVIEE